MATRGRALSPLRLRLSDDKLHSTPGRLQPCRSRSPSPSPNPASISASHRTPPIAALFLIRFDLRAGYTIAWKRSLPGIELEGSVEFKSLPSGLHNVREDLIYFVHSDYAGLSAFLSTPASEAERNAVMLAVGVLVPSNFERLGRCWKHAEALKRMAQQLVADQPGSEAMLDEYWTAHRLRPPGVDINQNRDIESTFFPVATPTKASKLPNAYSPSARGTHLRIEFASEGALPRDERLSLPPYHPGRSLKQLLSALGPLVFPVYRAALLRKRILLSCDAPVHRMCDFVYDISIISSIPAAVVPLVQSSAPRSPLRPLFSIGVHDIPILESWVAATSRESENLSMDANDANCGWIACTTDSILAQKPKLYDFLITMPKPILASWPTIQSAARVPAKATQRDLRRYRAMGWSLSNLTRARSPGSEPTQSSTLHRPSSHHVSASEGLTAIPEIGSVVEPFSWPALAYSGFLWWASAGRYEVSLNDDEASSDATLMDGLFATDNSRTPTGETPRYRTDEIYTAETPDHDTDREATLETRIIAYFHRLTANIFTILADLVRDSGDSQFIDNNGKKSSLHPSTDSQHSDDEPLVSASQQEEEVEILITDEDMTKMGLDKWSMADKEFVIELCALYLGRKARVQATSVDICGIRIY